MGAEITRVVTEDANINVNDNDNKKTITVVDNDKWKRKRETLEFLKYGRMLFEKQINGLINSVRNS